MFHILTSSNCAPAVSTGDGNVMVYGVKGGVPETVTKPPKTSEPSVVAPVTITPRAPDPTLCTRQLLPSAVRR